LGQGKLKIEGGLDEAEALQMAGCVITPCFLLPKSLTYNDTSSCTPLAEYFLSR
jgi:hypothetical protein